MTENIRVAIIDDDEVAGVLLAELAALGKQQAALAEEQEALRVERAWADALGEDTYHQLRRGLARLESVLDTVHESR